MQTIKLKVNDTIYKNLMWFLNKFSKDELEIIEEDNSFLSVQKELKNQLENATSRNAEFIGLDQLDEDLEATIKKHES